MKRFVSSIFILFIAVCAVAQKEYYTPVDGKKGGEELKISLNQSVLEGYLNAMEQMVERYSVTNDISVATLSRLPEAVILPLCPDKGACMSYDPNLAASVYLENDLELLMRTHS